MDTPSDHLALDEARHRLQLRMIRRDSEPLVAMEKELVATGKLSDTKKKTSKRNEALKPAVLPLFGQLTDTTLARVRKDFPGWDVYALQNEFDDWIAEHPNRRPSDYQPAFYGFVRQFNTRERGDRNGF